MAKYRITAPDGTLYEVTAPDGVTDADVLAFARQSFTKQPEKAPDPTEGMSGFDKFAAGMGKAAFDTARGLGQLVGAVSREDVAEARKRDAALMNTGAGMSGNIAGNLAILAPTAMIPGAATIPGAALIGAGTGLAQPSTSTQETLQNTGLGAVAGPAAILAGRGIAAGVQGTKALIEPFNAAGRNRIAGRVLDEFAADPAAMVAARSAQTATGARPMLSEASRDTGIATLERSLAQQEPKIAAQFAQRAMDNNAARVGVVQGVAGDAAKRQAAEQARAALADPLYAIADDAVVQLDGAFASMLNRPAFAKAVDQAQALAKNEGIADLFFRGSKGEPVAITGQGAHYIKKALDDLATPGSTSFMGKAAGSSAGKTQETFLKWLDKTVPEYAQAKEAFAQASKPINAMDVGGRLLDKTTSAMRDLSGNNRLQANAFARALNDEETLLRQATGFRGRNALADVMTPQQVAGLNAVRDELELAANLATAANGPGSQTAKSLASQNLLRRLVGPTGMPQSWAESALLQGVARPLQFAMKTAEPKIQNRLAEILMDPDQAAAVVAMSRSLPLSSRVGAAAEPFLPQFGLNPLLGATANRPQ